MLSGQSLVDAQLTQPHLQPFRNALRDATVRTVQPRGKAIITSFDNDLHLYSHNQLYGRWYITAAGRPPATNRTLRVALHTQAHTAWLYSASDIEVLDPAGLSLHPYLTKLGPDAVEATTNWRTIAARLTAPEFRARRLYSLYLDQHFVAGIGNYLRSEILFVAGLHPSLRPCDLSRGEIGQLARATLNITRRSYQTGGITNAPALAARMQRKGHSYEDRRFAVFARAGQPCHTCSNTIERSTAGSRRLYHCPTCQRARTQ